MAERKSSQYRLVAIAGASGTGKSLLVKKLAQRLGWPIFSNSKKLREIAHSKNIPPEMIHSLSDSIHQEVDRAMAKTIRDKKDLILESRLCGWQAKKYQDILRVLCTTDPEVRAKRYAERENISLAKAAYELEARDRLNAEKFQQLYQAGDYLNPKYYQLIINTSEMTPEEEVELVIKALGV